MIPERVNKEARGKNSSVKRSLNQDVLLTLTISLTLATTKGVEKLGLFNRCLDLRITQQTRNVEIGPGTFL